MRGKGPPAKVQQFCAGITPAYAGKSFNDGYKWFRLGDHPRLCGEKLNGQNGSECVIGSPPPMRGKAFSVYSARAVLRITPAYAGKSAMQLGEKRVPSVRITPAYAGKSTSSTVRQSLFEDHPRLCGEKDTTIGGVEGIRGSPPPMRGKAPIAFTSLSFWRITPAYAGKSLLAFFITSYL